MLQISALAREISRKETDLEKQHPFFAAGKQRWGLPEVVVDERVEEGDRAEGDPGHEDEVIGPGHHPGPRIIPQMFRGL